MRGKARSDAGRLCGAIQVKITALEMLTSFACSSNGFSKEALKNRKEEVLRLELFFNEVNCLSHLAQFSNLSQVIFFGTGTQQLSVKTFQNV